MRSAIVKVPVVFGGTFDPIHLGHIDAAKTVSRLLGGVHVQMMLAGNPRLRDGSPESIEHRWRMLRLACEEEINLIPDSTETHDGGATRTIETIERLGGNRNKPVIWVLGDDAASNMPHWVRYESLPLKSSVFILKRTDVCLTQIYRDFELVKHPTDLALEAGRIYVSRNPVIDISATRIRSGISQGKSVGHWLHPEVYTYIIDMHLYRT